MGIGGTLDEGGSSDAVESSSTFSADNRLVRTDGTGRNVQDSNVTLNDTGQLLVQTDGNTPMYSFADIPTTGIYANTSIMGFLESGGLYLTLGGASITIFQVIAGQSTRSAQIENSPGTTSNVSYGFNNDPDTGMYSPSANNLHFVTAGNEAIEIDANGVIRKPLQPAFNAYMTATATDVTGDGTEVFLGDSDVGAGLTERFDKNNNFTPSASGGAIFTAPVTGTYQFNFTVLLQDCTAGTTTYSLDIVTSNETYTYGNSTANGSNQGADFSIAVDMDAADTAQFSIEASGGSKVVDINGGADSRTWISGFLVG